MENIATNLVLVRNQITAAALKYNRDPKAINLLAVSKAQPIEAIKTALAAGQKDFGESYTNEFLLKFNDLQKEPIIWHYIGRIQSRKAKILAQHFSWVHTVASAEAAELLNKHRAGTLPPLNVCIQVNINQEASKAGVLLEEIMPLAQKIAQLPRLKLRGLMIIPSYFNEFSEQLQVFQQLAIEQKKLQNAGFAVDTLSMGMSHDFEAAIAADATVIRIGSKIFGARNYVVKS